MENKFNNRDFEQFVKQNADQYRMFPSEKVWRGIHHSLHTRSRWYGIGLALLLLTAVSVTWVMLIPSNKNQQVADKLPPVAAIQPATQPVTETKPVVIAPVKPAANKVIYIASADNQHENLFIADLIQPAEKTDEINNNETNPVTATITESPEPAGSIKASDFVVKHSPVYNNESPVSKATQVIVVASPVKEKELLITEKKSTHPVILKEEADPAVSLRDINLLTIESVVNSYEKAAKKNKFALRAYFTPTISYRRLREDNPFISASRSAGSPASTTLAIADVNSVVTHKPDIGLQLGVNGGYPLTKKLTFIAGLQFNVSKYDIRAYDYPSETATIALISGTTVPNSVSTETTYRNYSGSTSEDWLSNLYFSASLPIGLELRLSGKQKTEIGIGGTIQPTYLLGNRTYLLSTDYKNYAEVPSLTRKWNMSTSLEAFAGYSTGKINWRIGPQVRYQLLSSYRKQYPVKEHLFDYGLKIGIMLNK